MKRFDALCAAGANTNAAPMHSTAANDLITPPKRYESRSAWTLVEQLIWIPHP
jgi:hypothetical protein